MALVMIDRPSWPYRPAAGHDPRGRALPDRAQLDQGPAQEVIGQMAWLLRDTRGSMLLGGSVLSAIAVGISLLLGAARLARRRTQVADTWTYIAAAYFLIWIVVILLGL